MILADGTERCAAASESRGEPMAGTASTVRSWLLLEHPGPWGRDAFVDTRLPERFGRELLVRCRAADVRTLLIRRPGGGDGSACFAIRSGPGTPWIERTDLDRIEDVIALNLDALGRGERLGLEPVGGALFLVCTHGRHDPCCAERGRPLGQALSRAFPDETWETTHIGGDRFAGNLVAFPHGIYFGRVAAEAGERIARGYLGGRLALDHLRGRSCYPMAVQAAEHALRSTRGLDRLDDVALERATGTGRDLTATFRTSEGSVRVRIRIDATVRRRLTCHSEAERSAPRYEVLAIG